MTSSSQFVGEKEDTNETTDATLKGAQDVLENVWRSICTEVEEHPTRTLLIAGSIGLALGALWATNKYIAVNNSPDWSKLPRQYAEALRNFRLPT